MSDYLQNLVSRSLDPSRAVRPRLSSLFEPPVAGGLFAAAFPSDTLGGAVEPSPSAPATDVRSAATATPSHAPHADVSPTRPTQPPTSATRSEAPRQISSDAQAASLSSKHIAERAAPSEEGKHHHAVRPDAASLERTDMRDGMKRDDTTRRDADSEAARAELKKEMRPDSREAVRLGDAFEPRLVPVTTRAVQAPQSSDASPTPASDAAPTIRVTIGRIDVRAVFSDSQQQQRSRPARPTPALTLEDYLRQRKGGAR